MSHARTIPLSKFDIVLDKIYSNPAIAKRADAAQMRRKAEANCLSYISTEAVRIGAHGEAASAILKSARRDPSRLPVNLLKYAGAYLGL